MIAVVLVVLVVVVVIVRARRRRPAGPAVTFNTEPPVRHRMASSRRKETL